MGKMTQNERILRHLHDFGSITALEAMKEYSCMRLGARIHELKRAGYQIDRKMEQSKNRYGERVTYARYTLKEAG